MSTLNSIILRLVSGEDSQLMAVAIGLAAILTTATFYHAFKDKGHEFPRLPGIQLYHAWMFFQWRYDFLRSNIARNPEGFSFHVLYYNVIVLAGEDARRAFFSNPSFDFYEGHKIFVGAVRVSRM